MILIEFRTNEQSLKEDEAIGLVEKAALLETYLVLPVKFSVDTVDLLEILKPQGCTFPVDSSGNVEIVAVNEGQHFLTTWVDLPLLSFAITCYEKVREACNGEKSLYEIPGGIGYLHFDALGSKVRIYSTINRKTVETDCLNLLEAFAAFSVRVRDLAEHLFPELKMDTTWKSWFM